MQMFRSARWLMLALLVSLVPASSHAAVSISVGFAPPLSPVYVQPVCPDPGLDVDAGVLGIRAWRLLLGTRRMGSRSLR